ncbi:MAG: hypothetical protein ABR511_02120 [Acidimicrobiales bacterium]
MGASDQHNVTIRNLTARRIEIARVDGGSSGLIISPFGDRTVPAGDVELYDVGPWKAQRLVDDDPPRSTASDDVRRNGVYAKASGYSFLAAMTFAAVGAVHQRMGWLVGVVAALALTGLLSWRTHWDPEAWRSMARSFNIFLGMLMAFGATAGAIWLNYPDPLRHRSDAPDVVLALIILWLFMAMASVLPAALFLFFHRQKVPTLRANFLRDVVRLDPNVQTIEDAESRYDVLIRDVYGSGDSGASAGRRLPILAATGVITGLWIWTLVPGLSDATTIRQVLLPEPDIVTFAFLGAYVFAINMLFRRYARADLGPKAYTHVMVRIFAAIATVWVLSFAPFATTDGRPRSLMLLLAFFVGIVPETGTAIVQDLLQQWKPVARAIPSLAEDHPISRIEGISLYDRAQFLEVGIENVESLAHHDIVELMLWTRIPTARLVDFMDQAILYLHLRGPRSADDTEGRADKAGARTLLVRHGIRTATDLERAYAMAASRSKGEADALLGLVDSPGLAVRRLRVVMDAMEDDEWMVYVRNWRDQTSVGEPVGSVEEFVALAARGTGPTSSTAPPSAVDGGNVGVVDSSAPHAPVRAPVPAERPGFAAAAAPPTAAGPTAPPGLRSVGD